jgi:hypothetical protein
MKTYHVMQQLRAGTDRVEKDFRRLPRYVGKYLAPPGKGNNRTELAVDIFVA